MIRKLTALAAAAAFALTSFAPVAADARDRRHDGYYGRQHDGYNDYRRRNWRDRDDRGDAVAAGVIGLVLGLAIGAAASQPREPRGRCYDNYRRCEPPPRDHYEDGYYQRDPRYDRRDPRYDRRDPGYDRRDPRYEDPRSAYDREYGVERDDRYEQCTRTERQWDRYANRYVVVEVPC